MPHLWSAINVFEALPGVLGNRKKGIYFKGNKDNIGDKGTYENKFSILGGGDRGTSQLISGEQGNRYPWEGLLSAINKSI